MKIEKFIKDWEAIRGRTLEFLEKVPGDKITWRPHELLGTFGMQIRHIGKSQESYINGIKKGKIDFSDKSFDPELENDKKKGIEYLKSRSLKHVKGCTQEARIHHLGSTATNKIPTTNISSKASAKQAGKANPWPSNAALPPSSLPMLRATRGSWARTRKALSPLSPATSRI